MHSLWAVLRALQLLATSVHLLSSLTGSYATTVDLFAVKYASDLGGRVSEDHVLWIESHGFPPGPLAPL